MIRKSVTSPRWSGPAVIAASLVLAVTVAGCSGDTPVDTSSSSSSQSVEAAPANPGDGSGSESTSAPTPESEAAKKKAQKEMSAGDLDSKQMSAVKAYLEIRENSESTRYKDPAAWESALKTVTTKAGLKTALASYRPERVSNARQVAERLGYEVKVVAGECRENPGFGSSGNQVAVQCSLTDLVTDSDGDVIKSSDVDITWPYFGKQQSPTLVLAKESGKWLVDGDYTGRAS